MNRIILHHTGGAYRPNSVDLRAYHRLIDGDGKLHDGEHPISANEPGRPLVAGRYAAHCRHLNSGSIGISVCALAGATWARPFDGAAPIRPGQVDALVAEAARLCQIYRIEPTGRFVLSHAEVDLVLGVRQHAKWDYDYPPRGGTSSRDPIAIGNELREEICRAIGRHVEPMMPTSLTAPSGSQPVLSQGSIGQSVRELQARLGGLAIDGEFGPRTRTRVVAFQTMRQLLPDGIVGPMTWAALL
ncbi:N-acetylmuramoyl-L-alanine amidase [Pseudoroseicyclus sp. CXY001]|uniref:peptidoglycan recognition protein family protein n=1 Tax=Pseudoroseicyclus sp. CXY001 TaxID=3242492 RepID=UPI00357132F7